VIRHVALEHGHHIQNRLSTGESMDDDSEKGQEHLTKQESIENSSSFKFIVTRPTVFLRDGPSKKKLAASKSVSLYLILKRLVPSLIRDTKRIFNHCCRDPILAFVPNRSNLDPFPYHMLIWQIFH